MIESVEQILHRRKFFQDKKNFFAVVGVALLNAGSWALLYFTIHAQEDPIFLHYNIYFGVDLIGQWYRLYLMPLIGLAVAAVDTVLAAALYRRARALSYVLLGITVFLQLLLLLSVWLIIRQNA